MKIKKYLSLICTIIIVLCYSLFNITYSDSLSQTYFSRGCIIFQNSKCAFINYDRGIFIYDKLHNNWILPDKNYCVFQKPLLKNNYLYIPVMLPNGDYAAIKQEPLTINVLIYNLSNYMCVVSSNIISQNPNLQIDGFTNDNCMLIKAFDKDNYLSLSEPQKAYPAVKVNSSGKCYGVNDNYTLTNSDSFFDWNYDSSLSVTAHIANNLKKSALTLRDIRFNNTYIFNDYYSSSTPYSEIYGKYWPPRDTIANYFPFTIASRSKTILKGNAIYIGSNKDYIFYSEEFPYDSVYDAQSNIANNDYIQNFKSFIVALERKTLKQYIIKFSDKYIYNPGIFSIDDKLFYYNEEKEETIYPTVVRTKTDEIPHTYCTTDKSDTSFKGNNVAEYPKYKLEIYDNSIWHNNKKIYNSTCIIQTNVSNNKLYITDFKGKYFDKLTFDLKDYSIKSSNSLLSKIDFFNNFNY